MIVNELGRIDIDTRLVKSRSGDVMELVGGCVCHEVRVQSELWAAIAEVVRRSDPEVVVLETTGIAEPWSILDGLESLPRDEAPAVAAGVVCVVDAEAGAAQLDPPRGGARPGRGGRPDPAHQARSRLARRGRGPARELARRNPAAERASFPDTDAATADARALAARRARAPARRAPARGARGAHAHGQLAAVAYADPAPLLAEPLLSVIDRLGPALVRAKGFVDVAGELHRAASSSARAPAPSLQLGEAWGADSPRTELVLIGEGLDAGAIRRQLWACRARR